MTEKKNSSLGVKLFLTVADYFIEKCLTDDEIKAAEKEYGSGRLKRSTNIDYSKKTQFTTNGIETTENPDYLDPKNEIKSNYEVRDIEN